MGFRIQRRICTEEKIKYIVFGFWKCFAKFTNTDIKKKSHNLMAMRECGHEHVRPHPIERSQVDPIFSETGADVVARKLTYCLSRYFRDFDPPFYIGLFQPVLILMISSDAIIIDFSFKIHNAHLITEYHSELPGQGFFFCSE
jgi:hypothetical protein